MAILNFIFENQWLLFLILAWSLVWKGWAPWIAARKKSVVWFIVLLVVNTVGILEILYIFVFSKRTQNDAELTQKNAEIS